MGVCAPERFLKTSRIEDWSRRGSSSAGRKNESSETPFFTSLFLFCFWGFFPQLFVDLTSRLSQRSFLVLAAVVKKIRKKYEFFSPRHIWKPFVDIKWERGGLTGHCCVYSRVGIFPLFLHFFWLFNQVEESAARNEK
jgi:hypothetical protein